MKEFKFKELINGIENLPKPLLNYNSVLYRIYDKSTNKNYIGTAKYGLPGRLYDGFHGHVILFRSNNEFKCRGMYHNMNINIDNFSIFIEDEDTPNNYDRILLRETELIKEYDSVLFGYNVSIDGKPGWKEGSICVNDGKYDIYIYQEDISRFLDNGFNLGSCKHNFLKGTIWVNNGVVSKMIDPNEYEKYREMGFNKGSLISPNLGKIWINNGQKSILVDKSLVGSNQYKDYKFIGRIEPTRKKRGKYSAPKKTLVNNGVKELRIESTKVGDFIKENPNYKLGRIKKSCK